MAKYVVTIYNQAACNMPSGGKWTGYGRTRKDAFKVAIRDAGEEFFRAGGRDCLTTLRTLFAEHLMSGYYRTSRHASASHPMGCSVEFRKLS